MGFEVWGSGVSINRWRKSNLEGECVVANDAKSESFLVTVPRDWKLEKHATDKRKFSSIQEFIRELIRRDIETFEKEKAEVAVTKAKK